ncbi:MAG: FMN-binding protein [Proteobacteria bacterium]|nr:FMN-binding protein [Pseudomonadota bacterium]
MGQIHGLLIGLGLVVVLGLVGYLSEEVLLKSRQDFDRQNLTLLFEPGSFDNDPLLDSVLIPASGAHASLVNVHLLGLNRDRLAYIARQGTQVTAIAVPATADDGFNGTVELLVAVDMFGRIRAARVIDDLETDTLYGVVAVIQSKWMEEFTNSSMRDILGISWKVITPQNEYDQFVGASITPKTVSNRIYDALVFFQSNRIVLMAGES